MAVLSNESLFDFSGQPEWRKLIDLLAALDNLTSIDQAAHLRRELLNEAASLADELPATLRVNSPEYRRWVTEAVLLWPHFADASGKALLNTIEATAMVDFPVDFTSTENDRRVLRGALQRLFDWAPEELANIDSRLEKLMANLRIKKAIAAGVTGLMGADRSGWRERAVALMRSLYGPLPWRPGDIDVVVTTAALFLCVRFQGAVVSSPDWETRPAGERAAITRFLEQANAEQLSLQKVRFPAFGAFDPDAVSTEFLDEMASAVRRHAGLADITRETLASTLSTMVSLLPTADVDKYLIHDAAGHGWQETLCEFEWTFRLLPRISDPIDPAGLRDAFEDAGGRTALRPESLTAFVDADLRHRIVIGLNVVMSESLADLVEHKLLRAGHPLPSSSLLPEAPLKLDLSLADARRMIRGWRTPYRKLIRETAEREALCQLLRSTGLPEAGLTSAVDEAARLIEERFGAAFETSLAAANAVDGRLRVNLLQRIMMSMVTFDCAVDKFLKHVDAHNSEQPDLPLWRTPIASLDLLVLLLGWIYEQERSVHIWHMDELLNEQLATTLRTLEHYIQD